MAVTIQPTYSSEVKRILIDVEGDTVSVILEDKEFDTLAEMYFDSKLFLKHLKIVSNLHNSVELKPNMYSKHESILQIRHSEYDDILKFSYSDFYFDVNNQEIKEIVDILLS